jgi:hypothetical protein
MLYSDFLSCCENGASSSTYKSCYAVYRNIILTTTHDDLRKRILVLLKMSLFKK